MRDVDLVRATIELAHALGSVVVAEGVEEGSTLDLLEGTGATSRRGTTSAGPPRVGLLLPHQPGRRDPARPVDYRRAAR